MYCQKCGAQTDDQAAFCDKCGTALQKASPETGATAPTYPAAVQYAGFWRRLGAAIIDGLIVGAVTLVIYLVLIVGGISTGGIAGFFIGYFIAYALAIILGWLYYALMESSAKQATLGKMALGIIVTDAQGQGVSFARATGRHFGKILSGIILYIGYIMIAFTAKKQGLHDILADCLVVVKR
jgi:uncharacterized RDD family membrane protein YckC